jgi:hypothetical protein
MHLHPVLSRSVGGTIRNPLLLALINTLVPVQALVVVSRRSMIWIVLVGYLRS